MYGYVRPVKDELKIRQFEAFRGVYCGLCHTLRRRYGVLFRFAVNYDLTFLAMLLAGPEPAGQETIRCPYHPLRKTACPSALPSLVTAADYSVILGYWKLRDAIGDRGFPASAACRVLCLFMRRAYRRAAAARPAFARAAEENIAALSEIEESRHAGIDAPADKFALMLAAAAEGGEDPDRKRVLRELLYHLGRIVYLLDAADDLADDDRRGSYNPLLYRFSVDDGKLSAEEEKELRLVLDHSQNSVCSAFALLGPTPYTAILENIIYLGLPAVSQAVFSGTWRAAKHPWPSRTYKKERSRL